MYAALNSWSDKFLINLLVQDMEQKLWLYIRARGAKISSCMLPHFLISCLQRDSGVAVLGVMPRQAPVGVTEESCPPQHARGWDSSRPPRQPVAGTPAPGPAGRVWKRCQAGRRAAQSCDWHFMLMALPLFLWNSLRSHYLRSAHLVSRMHP